MGITPEEFAHHKADFARHEIQSLEREQRISRLESSTERQEKTMDKFGDQLSDIHAVMTNGLKDKVAELSKAINDIPRVTGKKPRRLEILTAVIAVIAVAQSIGLMDSIRAWIGGAGG